MSTTSFYSQQAANRRKSLLLMFSVAALLCLLGFLIGFGLTGDPVGGIPLVVIALIVAVLLSLGSYFQGDRLVLAASRAREVSEADDPQLHNVVQELSIAAGIPKPRVYVIEDSAPNAFATGRDPQHASLAITTGLREKLDREELQGVIGHELSHVRNFDIRFSLLMGVLVGSIALLADMFLRYTFWFGGGSRRGGGNRKGGGAQVIVLVLALLLAILAPIVARLIQLSVNRQREYLADASSVELTRNPAGLERALAKIATDQDVLEVANRATQHMYFTNPIKEFEPRSQKLLSTHPPTVDRINRLRELTGSQPVTAADLPALATQ